LSDDDALALLAKQGVGKPADFGPNAPATLQEALTAIQQTRQQGFSLTCETYAIGLSALSAPVRFPHQAAMGVLTIAGPSARFTPERMQALAAELVSTADQLAAISGASPFFSLSHTSTPASSPAAGNGRQPIYAL
jgi:DNA-binding IclR family transcriptional regulator